MTHTVYKREGHVARELRRRAGTYIKGLRLDAGLTQRELASRLHYPYYTFISQVELGVTRVPPDNMSNWARALGVPVAEFSKELLRFYDPDTFACLFNDGVVEKYAQGRKHSRTTTKD